MPVDSCTIVGSLSDVGIVPMNALLRVTNYNTFIDATTSPETIIPKSNSEFTINAGNVNINLPVTEVAKISIRLQFYERISATPLEYDSVPFLDFYAVIPNVTTYQLSALMDTGITNDNLATGARRVARAIFEDNSLVTLISSSLKQYIQTTKPLGVADNSLWINPDNGLIWLFDAANSRWISDQKQAIISNSFSDTSTIYFPIVKGASKDILVNSLRIVYTVVSPNNSTNYWTIKRALKNWIDANPTVDNTNSSNLIAPAIRTEINITDNTVRNLETLQGYGLELTKTLSPGSIGITASLSYNYILGAT